MRRPRMLLVLAGLAFLAPGAGGEPWKVPRMAWGVPDLQDTWSNATISPLERPDGVDRLVLTPEEARRWEQGTADFMASIDDVPEGELPSGEDVGATTPSGWMRASASRGWMARSAAR